MKEKIKLTYRIILILITLIALILNFKLFTPRIAILYFTNLSNLLVLIYFIALLITTLLKIKVSDKIHYILKGMTTMSITLTMAVFNLLLTSDFGSFEGHMLECNLVHLVVPLLTIFDYILFEPKGNLKKIYTLYWTIPLILYQFFVTIYSTLGGKFSDGESYPYFFMNINQNGIPKTLIYSIILMIIYIVFGLLIVKIDNLIKNKKKETK